MINLVMRPERRRDALDPLRQIWAASTCLALAISESDHPRAIELVDMHDRACMRLREADLAARFRSPTVRVDGVHSGDSDALARQIAHDRRHLASLRGAASALLAGVHRAGGWQVAEPAHTRAIAQAFEALGQALQDSLGSEDDLPTDMAETTS